ncbi:hypothetical protein JHK85_001962 [Glycine max]|uniref:Uncharacterized protein n=1 Tax=Glycine soja TaxID=3848 RepID=A0A0B2R9A0_GLYSO|nr:hypothetical protein JHK85_001962 [Glycine max]KAG5089296.1 hypothetical protein JHK86_001908 [Glycine max]KHN28297.1 hypothetical protein glysoja_041763 [Glycine soja]
MLVTAASSMWESEKEKVVVQGDIVGVVSLVVMGYNKRMNEKSKRMKEKKRKSHWKMLFTMVHNDLRERRREVEEEKRKGGKK